MTTDWHFPVIIGLLAGLWWLLSGGDPTSWVIGLPTVALAAWSAWRLRTRSAGPISVSGLLRFFPFFLGESVRGGIDVALRTLAPRMRVCPGFAVYHTMLKRQDARVFLVNCVSLLPGTLAADLEGDRIDIHLLDVESDPGQELGRLEMAVAAVYPET